MDKMNKLRIMAVGLVVAGFFIGTVGQGIWAIIFWNSSNLGGHVLVGGLGIMVLSLALIPAFLQMFIDW